MVKNGDLIDVEPDGSITVAGKPIGGGGGSENDREITLTMPYASSDYSDNKKLYIDDDTYNKISNYYYESIKLYFNDGNPCGVFHVFNFNDSSRGINTRQYAVISHYEQFAGLQAWYGTYKGYKFFVSLLASRDSQGNFIYLQQSEKLDLPFLDKAKFDALYKLADKPTQDGTYVLKATVSGGAVTYTWVAQ